MKTGTLSGFLTGTILSGVVLGTISVITQVPASTPEAGAVEVPAGSEFNAARDDEQASLPSADDTPEAGLASSIDQPEPDDIASLQGDATAPANQPETGEPEAGLIPPESPDEVGGVTTGLVEPVLQSPQTLAPQVPASDPGLSISTEPSQPVQPDVSQESGAFTQAPEPVPLATSDSTLEPEAQTDQPAAPEQGEDPEPQPQAQTDTVQTDLVQSDSAQTDPAGAEPVDIAALVPKEETEKPTGTIGNLAEEVETNRLPSVTDAPEPEASQQSEAEAEAETGVETDAGPDAGDEQASLPAAPLPPLQAFATPFENPESKPLMAIVLLVDGSSPISHEALADFPYPISYAIDATDTEAADAAQVLRGAGQEVLAMVNLPEGGSAADTEVTMQTALSTIPEAVAVMEGTGSGLQSTRDGTEQLIPILKESGHGLVLFSEGLDTAQKLIAREGVPALSVFRDFDSKGQNASAVKRFLDQAAFRAGQEETGVIMVGRLRAETAMALLHWGLAERASSVAIAPVSALLQASVSTQ